MGNANARELDEKTIYNELAFQIVHVEQGSPAHQVGLVAYYDFIVELPISIIPYNTSYGSIDRYLALTSPEGREVELEIFSLRTKSVRRVTLTAQFYRAQHFDLLGVIYRAIIINDAITNVEHVTEVSVGCPAYECGLQPYSDYIFATDNGDCFDLHRMLKPHNPGESTRCFVLNVKTLRSRCLLFPSSFNSSEECRVGCVLSRGYLHRIPIVFNPAEPPKSASSATIAISQAAVQTQPPEVCECQKPKQKNDDPETPNNIESNGKRKKHGKHLSARVPYNPEVCATVTTLQLPDQPGKTLSVSTKLSKSIVRDFLPQFIALEKPCLPSASAACQVECIVRSSPPPLVAINHQDDSRNCVYQV